MRHTRTGPSSTRVGPRVPHLAGGPLLASGVPEAGEGSLSGFLPALTNAIADAVGLRLTELPASPDRVLDALAARRRADRLRTAKAAAQSRG